MSAEHVIACREASRLLSASADRPLSSEEVGALSRHLDACLTCRNVEQQLEFLRKASRLFGSR